MSKLIEWNVGMLTGLTIFMVGTCVSSITQVFINSENRQKIEALSAEIKELRTRTE